ncbi:MAG TPA: NAD(P)-dependent oxidoreductase [Dehalococcoidia bacterium]|nr:NAD(P)-dependent oxidoreductase [Dehalococcoidia bacterium]
MHALILAPFSARCLKRLRERVDVTYESWLDTNVLQDPDELGARLHREGVDALVVEADFVFEELFEAAPGLRFVGVCRNALNHVDIERATAHGVAVVHTPGRNTNAVAEMTLGLMIALSRRIVPAHALVSGGGWRDPAVGYRRLRGREIAQSVIGIIGFGQIGRAAGRLCGAFGATVLANDPLVPDSAMRTAGVEPLDLDGLLARADFVSVHVPDNDGTHHLVDGAFVGRMQSSAYLVNTSGGAVVDPAALADALDRGVIAGAALDVFEGHPLPASSPLMTARNLIMTPHIGGATEETIERHSAMITDEIERFLDGRELLHCVNPAYATHRES